MKPAATGQKNKTAGIYFLAAVAVLYGILFALSPDGAEASLAASMGILTKLLPIILVVIVLLALLGHFFNARAYARRLSKGSGLREWSIALAGGILSHGPAFVWYPMLGEMRSHGVKEGLIVTFLYVRAIKLPWLPVMIDYFGWEFTLFFSCNIILAALMQGWIVNRIAR